MVVAKTSSGAFTNAGKSVRKTAREIDKKIIDPTKGWPGQAMPEDYAVYKTEDEELKKKIFEADAAYAQRTNIFSATEDLFDDEILILNDIVLDRVPTTAISITYSSDIFVSETIRTSAPSVSTGGRQDIAIELNLVFPPGKQQTVVLRRLMAELLNHPFVFIYNKKIRDSLSISGSENTIFVLENGAIRSLNNQPGSIALDLTLHYFNHKPFSNHFLYNTYLFGQSPQTDKPNTFTRIEPGSNDSDYSETTKTKEALETSKRVSKILDDKRSKNAPTLLPKHSDPWMYFANELENTLPVIDENYSDYIGFEVDKLHYLSPPPQARSGNSLKNLIDKNKQFKEIAKLWETVGKIPQEVAALAKKSQTTTVATDRKEINEYVKMDDSELAVYKLGNLTLKIDDETALNLAKIIASETGGRENAPYVFWALVNRFFYVWGNRNGGFSGLCQQTGLSIEKFRLDKSGNKRTDQETISAGISAGNFGFAKRLDYRAATWEDLVRGFIGPVSKQKIGPFPQLHKLIRKFRQGSISCPSEYASVDYVIQYWGSGDMIKKMVNSSNEYASGGGKPFVVLKGKEMFSPGGQHDDITKANTWKKNKGIPQIILPSGQVVITPTKQEAKKDIVATKTKQEQEKQRIKEAAESKEAPQKKTEGEEHKNINDRVHWIQEVEDKNGYTYYFRNDNVRNLFYETLCLHTSGKKEDHSSGLSLPNIACTALAVSFGHKLAPIPLASQKHYSYQFVGAGNKSGQLVFTFAGERGKESSDVLKNLFSIAKDNAVYFGQFLDEAGAIKLISEDYVNSRQNQILALAGISEIIISNVEERSIPDGTDKYALIVDFVARKPKEDNKLKRRFPSSKSLKIKLVKSLLSLVNNVNGKIVIDPNIARSRPNNTKELLNLTYSGRPYIPGKNVPIWVIELAIRVKEVCDATNKESPPVRGSTIEKTYASWGAQKLITGNDKAHLTKIVEDEASRSLPEASHFGEQEIEIETSSFDREVFTKNAFKTWSVDMERIVRKAKEHFGDEENFKRYFGEEVYNEMLAVMEFGTSGCYQDLMIPTYPGTSVSMPPEFYVYDDSDENSSIAGLSDSNITKKFLKDIISREVESHRKISLGSLGGNLYIARNFKEIKDRRIGELGYKQYELKQFEEENLFSDGALAWEPVFHRNGFDDEQWNTDDVVKWRATVSKAYGDDPTFGFLNKVIELAPSLKFISQTPEREVANTFGDQWNSISFGPNLKNLYTDAIMKGSIVSDSTLAIVDSTDNQDKLKAEAAKTGKNITVGTMTVAPDGTITVGSTEEEKQEAEKNTDNAVINMKGVIGALKGVFVGALAGIPLGLVGNISGGIAGGMKGWRDATQKAEEDIIQASGSDRKSILDKLNQTYQKLMPEMYNKSKIDILANEAASFSLAAKSKDINFRRAFPTFKIYFIEDDSTDSYTSNGKIIRAFDDFYSYSAIEEIRVIKSKDIAADLAVVRMANLGSNLFAKRFGDDYADAKQYYEDMPESHSEDYILEKELKEKQGLYSETEDEDPFGKFVFQNGVKIQIRIGYSDNPNELTSVFLGQIVEIAASADGKMLELVCQGFGAELESVELYGDNSKTFYSAQGALSAAILQPTIVNFGRRDTNAAYNPGEIRNQFSTPSAEGIMDMLTSPTRTFARTELDSFLSKYTFQNFPQDDNIFAPAPSSYGIGWYEKFWNNACTYKAIKQTPWEVFKEHELRHPGFVSLAVPYGHTARMTMFFGSKSQHYWCKPPSVLEVVLAEGARDQMIRARGYVSQSVANTDAAIKKVNELSKVMPSLAEAVLKDILGARNSVGVSAEIGRVFGRYVPFRNFHYFNSEYHIISNNIKCSSENIANEIEVAYFGDEDKVDDPSAPSSLANGEGSLYKVRLDDNIPEDKIKTYHDEFPSCITEFMAKRYAQGLFEQVLKEAYSGELTVIGDETIKPYDVINIEDKTIMMSGPAEVKEVIHLFNRTDGFVSIVSPGMCISVNEGFDVPLLNTAIAIQRLAWSVFDEKSEFSSYATSHGISSYTTKFALFYKLCTQEGAPVFIHPMTLAGIPFVPSAIKKTGNLYSSVFGRWMSWWEDLGQAWKNLDVSEELFKAKISLMESVLRYFAE